jgi:tRNA pseudouridine55 synthase
MLGFLNLHKSQGFTSHDCVAKVRRILQMKQVGHGGTLDPDAIGVLPIALGRATRLLQFLPTDKTYVGTIKLGIVTTTDDLAGEVITSQPVTHLDLATINQALEKFQGKISQIPPRYSAIQVGGKRLYDLARAGVAIDVPVREVEIFGIKILDWRPQEFPELDVEIACGAGTYIRSIARDLGEILGTGGTLAALKRTRSAGFSLDDGISLTELEALLSSWQPIDPQIALRHIPEMVLPTDLAKRWTQGQKIPHPEPLPNLVGEFVRIVAETKTEETGDLLGISQIMVSSLDQQLILVPKVVLVGS